MQKYIWVIVGSLVCGIAVAMLSGADRLPWLKFVPLALVGAGVAASIWWNRRARQMHVGGHYDAAGVTAAQPSPAVVQREQETMRYLQNLLDEKTMTWIGTEAFEGTWRDQHVRPLREFMLFDDNRGAMSDPQLEQALLDLVGAVRGFLVAYDTTTMTDPLLHGEIWRIVVVDQSGERQRSSRAELQAAVESLRAGAREVTEAYADVRRIAAAIDLDGSARH